MATPLYSLLYEDIVRGALREDLGRAGDLTTDAIVPPDLMTSSVIRARRPGRIAGLTAALYAFEVLDPDVETRVIVADGEDVEAGGVIAEIRGKARPMLSAERTALNLLGRLAGIATATREVVNAIADTKSQVVCTRKTTPLLRALEKHAVRAGGGSNHRFGLDDAILIKDNHREVAGSAAEAVRRARAAAGHLVKIELEVDDLEELPAVLELGIDAVLLDNMTPDELAKAVEMTGDRAITEASGNITPATAAAVAASGVDLLSIGWLTHSVRVLDIGLDFESQRS